MRSDTELYQHLKLVDKVDTAFRTLYDRYSASLYRFIYRFTLNREIIEEILQDIFLQLHDDKYDPSEGNLKSWLFTVAKNKSLNHIRKSSFEISNEMTLSSSTSEDTLDQSMIQEDLLTKLFLAESQLPIDLQHTWNLRKKGLSYQQISESLSIPVGTVKSRFHRLVEHLKKEFQL